MLFFRLPAFGSCLFHISRLCCRFLCFISTSENMTALQKSKPFLIHIILQSRKLVIIDISLGHTFLLQSVYIIRYHRYICLAFLCISFYCILIIMQYENKLQRRLLRFIPIICRCGIRNDQVYSFPITSYTLIIQQSMPSLLRLSFDQVQPLYVGHLLPVKGQLLSLPDRYIY